MTRLSAAEAQALSMKNDPEVAVDVIMAGIQAAATKGEWVYVTRDHGFGDGGLYTSEKNYPDHIRTILKELRGYGYNCDVKCREGQFVDMWLEVSWCLAS